MKSRHFSELASPPGCNGSRKLVRPSVRLRAPDPERRTLLLISDDTRLHQNLRCVANLVGQMVVRVDGEADVVRIVYAVQPAAVLLDLDLPAGIAWKQADA